MSQAWLEGQEAQERNTVEHEDGKKKVLVYGVNGVQGGAVGGDY
ncbi:MAG: hypothetical protein ACRDTR_07825 [Rubrobacter sp.]